MMEFMRPPLPSDIIFEPDGVTPAITERIGHDGALLPPGVFNLDAARLRASLAAFTGDEESYWRVLGQIADATGRTTQVVEWMMYS